MSIRDTLTSAEDLEAIHSTALRMLAELGIQLNHTQMREQLTARGCRIEGDRVYIPPEVVQATLDRLPDSFALFGRSTDCRQVIDLEHTIFVNTGIVPNIYDFETNEIRRSTLQDVETTTRVMDALDGLPLVYVSLVDATDMAPHMVTVCDFAAVLRNTTKPLLGPGVTNGAEAETIVGMARAVRGGNAEMLREYPLCSPFICPITPLRFPNDLIDALVVIAEAGLPLDVVTNPVMGLTSPYTVAASVALGHAEVLASAVMADTIMPGLPVLNSNTPSVADMRTLASTTGGPETGLIRRTVVELSHHLGIPNCAHGHTSSATLDFQAGDEKGINSLLIASARPSILGGMGAIANVTLACHEAIMVDNERYGAILRILNGVDVDEDHLGFEVVADTINTGDILTHPHTARYLRSAEVFDAHLADRRGLASGTPESGTSVNRARAEAKRLMETHYVEPLAASIQAEIDEVMDRYATR